MPAYCFVCPVCEAKQETRLMMEDVPEKYPKHCGTTMKRDFHAEHTCGILAESSINKGRFPYVDENLGHEPVTVESQQHRRRLMREQGLHDRELSQNARARVRDAKRRFY